MNVFKHLSQNGDGLALSSLGGGEVASSSLGGLGTSGKYTEL